MASLPALVVAVLASPLFAQTQDFSAEGLKALDAGQPAAAEPLFRQAVDATPGDYFGHFNLALALSMQNKDPEAVAEFRKTLQLKPGLYEADLNLGMVLLRDKNAADAVPVLKEAAEAKPELSRPNFLFAQALFATGDFAGAEAHYGIAAKADPKSSAPAELGLGQSLLKQGKMDPAAEHLRAAIALDARYRDSLLELAAAYEKSGQLPAAIAIYREFPENAAAKQRLNKLLLASNNFSAAIPDLEARLKSTPTVANRLALADAYTMTKQFPKAIEQMQLAAVAEPSNFEIRMNLGKALRDQHQYPAAAQQFLAAAKLQPDSLPAWKELATVLVIGKSFAEALAALDHAKALGKETPGQLYFRAISLDSLKAHQPAIDAYKQFLEGDGGKMPDEEFLARQRIRIIESEMKRR
ncbi:MAG TPA: tetratricopeptide repeat protein [Bryobacteraceae bacterium]|jgi:tetratricopeptide (TPR) repeat protein|nr:tetratricopeptide repeat protein [Bryobacteraceae bacterium]